LRKNSNAEPPKRFVPDFEVMFTTPPVTPPNSALSLCDCTLNSCSESMSGSATYVPARTLVLTMPST
jgi:hypothetical protein